MNIDQELYQIQQHVSKMGNKVIENHQRLMLAISTQSQEDAFKVMQEDEYINRKEEEIHDIAQRALALLTPVAKDLRMILASIKIASELERIGDHAKNIARQFIKNEVLFLHILDDSMQLEQQILQMLKQSLEVYEQFDEQSCFDMIEKDESINQFIDTCSLKLISDDHISRHDLFMCASILRSLERSGDHVKNICEHILYMMKGQHYDFG